MYRRERYLEDYLDCFDLDSPIPNNINPIRNDVHFSDVHFNEMDFFHFPLGLPIGPGASRLQNRLHGLLPDVPGGRDRGSNGFDPKASLIAYRGWCAESAHHPFFRGADPLSRQQPLGGPRRQSTRKRHAGRLRQESPRAARPYLTKPRHTRSHQTSRPE